MIGMVIAFLNKFLIKVMGLITDLELPFTKTRTNIFFIFRIKYQKRSKIIIFDVFQYRNSDILD